MQSLQQPRDGRLARTAAADDAQRPADRRLEADALERIIRRARILEPQIDELNMPFERLAHAVRVADFLFRPVHEVRDQVRQQRALRRADG